MTTTINNKHKKLNVPNLRFPEFQGEWEEHLLGNISDVTKLAGFEFTKYVTYEDTGSIIAIRGLNCKNGSLDLRDVKYIDNSDFSKLLRSKLYVGDILYTYVGTVGEVAVVDKNDKYYLAPNVSRIRLSKDYNSDFIKQLLGSKKFYNKIVFPLIATSSQPALSMENLRRFKLRVPSIKEQKKIASLFNAIDERIATQNKIIDKLQSLIKGLNDFLYTQYGGEVLTSFTELGTSYSGLSGKSAQDFGSGKPFITYLNVYSNNVIKENDFQYVAIKDDEKQNVVKYGDVLFTLSSETPEEVGVGSVYLGKEKVYLNSFCFGIHITNTEVAFSPYLSYYVSLTAFRKFIYPYAQRSTRFNLCKADFEKASIKLPTLADQKRIYSVLGHIDCKIETERQMLNLYNSQ